MPACPPAPRRVAVATRGVGLLRRLAERAPVLGSPVRIAAAAARRGPNRARLLPRHRVSRVLHAPGATRSVPPRVADGACVLLPPQVRRTRLSIRASCATRFARQQPYSLQSHPGCVSKFPDRVRRPTSTFWAFSSSSGSCRRWWWAYRPSRSASARLRSSHRQTGRQRSGRGLTAAAFMMLAFIAIVWGAVACDCLGAVVVPYAMVALDIALMLGSVDLLLLPDGTAVGTYALYVSLNEKERRCSRTARCSDRVAQGFSPATLAA